MRKIIMSVGAMSMITAPIITTTSCSILNYKSQVSVGDIFPVQVGNSIDIKAWLPIPSDHFDKVNMLRWATGSLPADEQYKLFEGGIQMKQQNTKYGINNYTSQLAETSINIAEHALKAQREIDKLNENLPLDQRKYITSFKINGVELFGENSITGHSNLETFLSPTPVYDYNILHMDEKSDLKYLKITNHNYLTFYDFLLTNSINEIPVDAYPEKAEYKWSKTFTNLSTYTIDRQVSEYGVKIIYDNLEMYTNKLKPDSTETGPSNYVRPNKYGAVIPAYRDVDGKDVVPYKIFIYDYQHFNDDVYDATGVDNDWNLAKFRRMNKINVTPQENNSFITRDTFHVNGEAGWKYTVENIGTLQEWNGFVKIGIDGLQKRAEFPKITDESKGYIIKRIPTIVAEGETKEYQYFTNLLNLGEGVENGEYANEGIYEKPTIAVPFRTWKWALNFVPESPKSSNTLLVINERDVVTSERTIKD